MDELLVRPEVEPIVVTSWNGLLAADERVDWLSRQVLQEIGHRARGGPKGRFEFATC
jgi:hypothetical protein